MKFGHENNDEAIVNRTAPTTGEPADLQYSDGPTADKVASSLRFSRPDWLADILRQRILDGVYKPGDRIREADLRLEFGFSNGPIREALQTIVAEGLAERSPYRGTWVREFTDQQIVEMFQVRAAMLEYAAELLARNCTSEVIATGREMLQKVDDWYDRFAQPAHPPFNGTLSTWLINSTKNEALRGIWETTMLSTLVYVNASLAKSRGVKTRNLIHQVVECIFKEDVSGAKTAMRALTQQIIDDLGIDGQI